MTMNMTFVIFWTWKTSVWNMVFLLKLR
jgi:hypothetical protein